VDAYSVQIPGNDWCENVRCSRVRLNVNYDRSYLILEGVHLEAADQEIVSNSEVSN
jgi:hypothetical protein